MQYTYTPPPPHFLFSFLSQPTTQQHNSKQTQTTHRTTSTRATHATTRTTPHNDARGNNHRPPLSRAPSLCRFECLLLIFGVGLLIGGRLSAPWKPFYKPSYKIGILEDTRNRTLHGILRVQSCFRGYKARCFVNETKKGISTLQSFIRGEKSRNEFAVLLRRHRAAVTIQKEIKCQRFRKRFLGITDATIVIQSELIQRKENKDD